MAEPDNITRLVTAELRIAYLRAKSAEHELQQISELLKCGCISPVDALMAVEHMGWAGFLHGDIREMVEKASGGKNVNAKR